jgi:hypothetical protein
MGTPPRFLLSFHVSAPKTQSQKILEGCSTIGFRHDLSNLIRSRHKPVGQTVLAFDKQEDNIPAVADGIFTTAGPCYLALKMVLWKICQSSMKQTEEEGRNLTRVSFN